MTIRWDEFLRSCSDNLFSETTFQKFASKWDWKAPSYRDDIYNNWRLPEKLADKENWGEVVDFPSEVRLHLAIVFRDSVPP